MILEEISLNNILVRKREISILYSILYFINVLDIYSKYNIRLLALGAFFNRKIRYTKYNQIYNMLHA